MDGRKRHGCYHTPLDPGNRGMPLHAAVLGRVAVLEGVRVASVVFSQPPALACGSYESETSSLHGLSGTRTLSPQSGFLYLRRLHNSAKGPLPGMTTKGTKTQKKWNDIERSICDFCAFCGESALLIRSHPISERAEHHVCRPNDLSRCEFCKELFSILSIHVDKKESGFAPKTEPPRRASETG